MNITAGIYKGRKIIAPDEKYVRPTLSKIRMSVFNVLFSEFQSFENLSFLDMFGGSGIIGLEAISRGFSDVTVFEKDRKTAQIIKNNYKSLNLTPKLFVGDSLKLVKGKEFDIIYIDPPYASGIYEECLGNLLNPKMVILEHTEEVATSGFEIIKQKKYGDKYITFLKNKAVV